MSQLHKFARSGGPELGSGIGLMAELVAALSDLGVGGEYPVHRGLGCEVRALVEHGGVDRGRGRVEKALAGQLAEDGGSLGVGQRPGRRGAWPRGSLARATRPSVPGGPGQRHGPPSSSRSSGRGARGAMEGRALLAAGSALPRESWRKSAETFPGRRSPSRPGSGALLGRAGPTLCDGVPSDQQRHCLVSVPREPGS